MRVRVGVSVRVRVVVAVVVSRTMLMLMLMAVLMFMFMGLLVVMGAHARRILSGQSASAIFTHQSISKEASSISRPARSSPLRLWHSGHSANILSD